MAAQAGRASAVVDVFISYAREDRDRAMVLVEALERAGRSVWWDVSIPAGFDWHKEITSRLTQAKCVVVLWSATSIHKEFVTIEAEVGKRQEKLIPVLIDLVDPPLAFVLRQCANLVGWEGETDWPEFRQLLLAITEKVDASSPAEAAAPAGGGLADIPLRPLQAIPSFAPARRALMRAGASAWAAPIGERRTSAWLRWAVASVLAVLVLWIDPFGVFAASQRLSQDSANRILGPLYPTTGRDLVSVVLWRDSSLAARRLTWPIPLAQHARALSAILTYRPKAVFFDIAFTNDRGDPGVELLREEIANYAEARIPLVFAAPSEAGEAIIPALVSALPAEKLAGVPEPIEDGFTRTYPEEVTVGGTVYKTAAFRLFQLSAPTDESMQVADARMRRSIEIVWGTDPHPINREIIGDCAQAAPEMPWQRLWAALVRPGTLTRPCPYAPQIPIEAITDSTRDRRFAELIENRFIILGFTVQSVPDEVTTPVNGRLPGAHLHAMALDNLLSFGNRYKSREPEMLLEALKAFGVVMMLGVLLAVCGRRAGRTTSLPHSWVRGVLALPVVIAIATGTAVTSFAIFDLPPADYIGTLGLALATFGLVRAGAVETAMGLRLWRSRAQAATRIRST